MTVRELKKGDYFTLNEIAEPKESQVYIRGEYDRTERKYECYSFDDVNHVRWFKGDRAIFTDFTF